MIKRWTTLLLAVLLLCVSTYASADKYDLLKPMWLHALEDMQGQKEAGVLEKRKEPKVISGDEALEVVRYAVYADDEYSPEAYVYAQLKNTGESIIRVNGATLNILDSDGRRIGREEYASVKPDVIMPGESLYITEWLYDFVNDLDKVDAFSVEIERSEYSRKKIGKLPEVRAYVQGDYLYAEVTNTMEEPLFSVAVVAVVTDGTGRMLDMLRDETYASVGAAPGSTLVFRESLERHALDWPDVVCEAEAWYYEE